MRVRADPIGLDQRPARPACSGAIRRAYGSSAASISSAAASVSIGAIFAIFPASATAEASVLRPGREQAAAGRAIHGPQTALVFAAGARVAAEATRLAHTPMIRTRGTPAGTRGATRCSTSGTPGA